jgi:hypothetical protein
LKNDALKRLEEFYQALVRNRFAGRREPHIPASQFDHLKQEAEAIFAWAREIHAKVKEWKKANGTLDERMVIDKLRDENDRELYPWMKYFGLCVRKLPRKRNWKGGHFSIANPANWSPVDLARVVMKDMLYHETGVQYPAGEIRKLVKAERGRR